MMIRLVPFSKGGNIRFYAYGDEIEYMSGISFGGHGDSDGGGADAHHARRSPTYDAAFVSSLQPVSNATRSVSETEWPLLVTYLKELGFNPEEVYTVSDYFTQIGSDPKSDNATEYNKVLKTMQDMDVEDFKNLAKSYFRADTTFISTGAMAAVNKELAKDAKEVSKTSIEPYMDKYYFSYDISKEVGDKLVSADDILHGEQAVQEIMDVFTERIKNNTWLSEGSKKNALEKLNNMAINVGRPDKWISEALNNIEGCTNALEDLYSIRKTRLNAYKILNGKPTKQYSLHAMLMDNSDTTLGEPNAFYQPNYNSITLLPFFITSPWYDASQNSAINYETYNTFGHEITHGFDTDGSKFDKNGDPNALWATQADSEEFDRRAKQLIAWYSSFDLLPETPGLKANGEKTIPEDIADLGGMELAYQCYNNYLDKNGFKGEQKQLQLKRYFYAYAQEFRSKYTKGYIDYNVFGIDRQNGPDVHSMNKERVNGIVSNCDGWYNTFNITSGKLYRQPSERVRIW
jgi:predicted metalloendopeptidase